MLKIIFLIGIVWDGVQLGPLGTAATNRPIMPGPGDYFFKTKIIIFGLLAKQLVQD
jgi:hypothetical protein